MDQPRYSYPPPGLLALAAAVLLGGRRSFRRDGQACIGRLEPPLRVLGEENIPPSGPALITFNHYSRPGFQAWWMALALAAVVPADIHFVMTGELTFPGKWYAPLGRAGSRWLLKRLARVYGFTVMPPMPPRPGEEARRARSVRAALSYQKRNPQAVLGLAPEGSDMPGGILHVPPAGAGRFVVLLAGAGMLVVPAAFYEADGAACLRFGPAYWLPVPAGASPDERDRTIARFVMERIAQLLPIPLQGEFVTGDNREE
jgi:MYXO-CTERM domain-containing protein